MSRDEETKSAAPVFRVLFLLVLAAIAFIILLNADSIKDTNFFTVLLGNDLQGEPATEYVFLPDAANAFAVYRDGLSILSSTGLSILDEKGQEALTLSTNLSKPVIKVAGKYLIGYDVGSNRFLYVRDNKIVANMITDAPVLTAEVNNRGWILVVSEKLGSKATCLIYNDNLELVYEWISSERYITSSAISDDCKSAVIGGLQQKEAGVVSTAVFIRFDSETPYTEYEFDDVVMLDVGFLKGGNVAVLTENKVTVFDVDGNVRGNFEFDSEQLHEYDFDGEDYILLHLARRGSSEISDVYVLNYDCEVEHSLSYTNIMAIDAEKNYFGILTSNTVVVYNNNLEKQFTTGILAGSKKLLVHENGAAYVLSTVGATIYR